MNLNSPISSEPGEERTSKGTRSVKKRTDNLSSLEVQKASHLFHIHSLLLIGGRVLDRLLAFYGSLFDLTRKDKSKIYRNLSIHYLNKGEHAKAVDLLKEWMRLEPSNPEASYQLAKALASVANYRSALGVINKTLRLDARYKESIFLKGTIQTKLKNYKEAAEAFEEFIASHPKHARAHYLLAMASDHAGDAEKAIEAMEKATELDPEVVKYSQHLGFLYERMGDHQKAALYFSKVMELEQSGEE